MSTIWTKIGGLTTPLKFLTALGLVIGFETAWASLSKTNSKTASNALASARQASCMRATNYFLPKAEDYNCKNKYKIPVRLDRKTVVKICPAAQRAARLQGSIQVTHNGRNYLYRYDKTVDPTPSGCSTTTGANNICLIPYIHIAADPLYHNMGDVIEVPELKGVMVPHPSGVGMMPHPGFLIVADTGGRIKNANRFDFFIGLRHWRSKDNPFGPHGLGMTDERKCIMSFNKIEKNSVLAQQVKSDLENLFTSTPTVVVQARSQASVGGQQ